MSSQVNMSKPFIDLVLDGRARARDIETYVEAWHNAPEKSGAASVGLHEFLGLEWPEYSLWVEHPESLRFILAARRANQPVEVVLEQTKLAGAAARSSDVSEASKVLRWLIERGRIEATPRQVP
jgi:hypothetical protein